MIEGIKAIIYPVRDIAQAKSVYAVLLGKQPDMDEPYYVGFTLDGLDVGLDPSGHAQGMTGPVSYWQVADMKGSLQALLDAGGQVRQDIKDVDGGKLIATVQDADGSVIGLIQPA